MKIKELELNNFRGFEHLKIQFPENNLAVFIGTNGSGKSSVLDALGMLFTQFLYKLISKDIGRDLNVPSGAFTLSKNDIRQSLDGYTTNWLKVNHQQNEWHWVISKSIDDAWLNDYDGRNGLNDLVQGFILNTQVSIPLIIYYQTNRILLTRDVQVSWQSVKTPQLEAYQGGFVPKLSKFNDFVLWFKETVDEENAEKIARQSFDYRDKRLEAVRTALEGVLNVMQTARYMNLHIVRPRDNTFSFEHINKDFILALNKNGQDFDINQLSDGEKTLIMLVCDIARRLTIANPALENKLEGEGVVMIDEIELHLHPAWQRNVLPALQQTFPNIQFIVTTHSPQVLGGIERESLFILKDFQLQEYTPHTKGRDTNSILKEVQGVDERLPAYREKLDKLAKLLDDENVNEAEKLLAELKKDLGERDVEIAKIETIMHFFDD